MITLVDGVILSESEARALMEIISKADPLAHRNLAASCQTNVYKQLYEAVSKIVSLERIVDNYEYPPGPIPRM